jgi:hypothetical protein
VATRHFATLHHASKLLQSSHWAEDLRWAGSNIASRSDAVLLFDTRVLSPRQEAQALRPALQGMLTAITAQRARHADQHAAHAKLA